MPLPKLQEESTDISPRSLGFWNWSVMHFLDNHTAAGYREISAPRLENNKSTVNPLLTTPRGLLYFKHLGGGGLIETRGLLERGGLFNLAEMVVVSALHKKLECKVKKLKYKKLEVMQPRIKSKSELPTDE